MSASKLLQICATQNQWFAFPSSSHPYTQYHKPAVLPGLPGPPPWQPARAPQVPRAQQLPAHNLLHTPPPVVPHPQFFQGYLGHPPGGLPEPLKSRVLKGKPVIEGRPGASLKPLDLSAMEYRLKQKYGDANISYKDVLSAAMYPKVWLAGGASAAVC